MNHQARRDREKEDRRESILDAAELVFFDKGFDRTPMDEIARRAQLSRALLYVYFTDKSAIMRGIMLRAGTAINRRFERAVAEGKTGMEQLRGIGMAYYAFSRDESNYFDVLTKLNTFPESADDDEQINALRECVARNTDLMVQAIENGMADGSVDAERVSPARQTAYFLQGALHGVIMQTRGPRMEHTEYPEAEALILYAINMLGRAMQPG